MIYATVRSSNNSDALNVALNIGLLTKDKLRFTSTKLGLRGERSITDGIQKFKLFDVKTKQVIFSLILQTPLKIVEFKRGGWEGLFDSYAKENSNKKEPRLRLRQRIRKPTNRTEK